MTPWRGSRTRSGYVGTIEYLLCSVGIGTVVTAVVDFSAEKRRMGLHRSAGSLCLSLPFSSSSCFCSCLWSPFSESSFLLCTCSSCLFQVRRLLLGMSNHRTCREKLSDLTSRDQADFYEYATCNLSFTSLSPVLNSARDLECFHGNLFLIFNRRVWPCIVWEEQARAILKTLLSRL